MKLGGSIVSPFVTAAQWSKCLEKARFAAIPFPIAYDASSSIISEVLTAAKCRNVTIAEVGVWRNPIALDANERAAALEFAKNQLAFADEIGANCCVNIVVACGVRWDGAHRENYSQ